MGKRAVFVWLGLAKAPLGVVLVMVLTYPKSSELFSFSMGSYVRQTVWGGKDAAAAAHTAINRLEERISWRRDGDVAAINANAGGEAAAVDGETGALLEEILELCQRSSGALDVTLGPVTRLWDFDNDPHLPGEDELKGALALVDYRKLSMDREEYMYAVPNEDGSHTDSLGVRYHTSLAEPGMALDLGAVGKGGAGGARRPCFYLRQLREIF